MKIEPRPYQKKFVLDLWEAFRRVYRVAGVAATGAGKTIIAVLVVRAALKYGLRVFFVVDLDALVDQTFKTFKKWLPGLRIGFIKGNLPSDHGAPFQIVSRQTIQNRPYWWDIVRERRCLIILDEGHKVAFAKVIREKLEPMTPEYVRANRIEVLWLVLTATPWRLSKKEGLGDLCDELVASPLPGELMDMGYLVRPTYFGAGEVNLEGVRTTSTGDFHKRDLSEVCDTPEAIAAFFDAYKEHAWGEKMIGFCVDQNHAKNSADYFNSHGVPSAYIIDSTSPDERAEIKREFRQGKILNLESVNILSEGFDDESVYVAGLKAPTMSPAKHFQQCGRAFRVDRPCYNCGEQVPVDQKVEGMVVCRKCNSAQPDEVVASWVTNCLILDQAGNVVRHGMPDKLQKYEMDKGRGGGPGVAPTRKCPKCGAINHAAVRACTNCGHEFPRVKRRAATGPLRRINEGDVQLAYFRKLAREAFNRDFAPNWCLHRFKSRFPEVGSPPRSYRFESVFPSPTRAQRDKYTRYLFRVAKKKQAKQRKKGQKFDARNWIKAAYREQFGRELIIPPPTPKVAQEDTSEYASDAPESTQVPAEAELPKEQLSLLLHKMRTGGV